MGAAFPRLRRKLAKTAPELARLLGGPLAGAAVSVVSETLLGDKGGSDAVPSEEALLAAVEGASPQALADLRLAALDLRRDLASLAVDEERIAASDRASARDREKALKDKIPGALAFVVVAGFFAVLSVMMVADLPRGAETEFSIMLGALSTMAAAVMNYYFGSSAGSREKTQLLEKRGGATGRPWL